MMQLWILHESYFPFECFKTRDYVLYPLVYLVIELTDLLQLLAHLLSLVLYLAQR